jgi:hypothetical protein
MNTTSKSESTKSKPTQTLLRADQSERLDLKFECATLFQKGHTARWISRMILERDKETLSHHTILRDAEAFDGTRKSLARKAYTPKDPAKAHNHQANRKKQWDYIIGYLFTEKKSFALAYADMAALCSVFGWGEPMTLNAAYHRYRKRGRFSRPSELEDKKKHYEKWANYAKTVKILANNRWQIDEFQFSVKGRGTHETTFFGVVCVDRAFQVVRYVELSLRPINKYAFMRCWKGALNGDSVYCPIPAKPLVVQVDNAQWHEPKHSEEVYQDFRQSGTDLDIGMRWNDPECPQQDCMVENWIGNFKRNFVKGFRCFVELVAPARSVEDWDAHMANLPRLIQRYCTKWNNDPYKDGMSRMDHYIKYAEEGSFEVNSTEIDHGVRMTEDRVVSKYGLRIGSVQYHRAGLGLHTGEKLKIRVRPEGAGPDVEAYRNGNYLGTLVRVTDDDKMNDKLNASYKREIRELEAEEVELRKRYLGFTRQLELKNYPVGSRMYNMILAAMEADEPVSTAGAPGSATGSTATEAVVAADAETYESELA